MHLGLGMWSTLKNANSQVDFHAKFACCRSNGVSLWGPKSKSCGAAHGVEIWLTPQKLPLSFGYDVKFDKHYNSVDTDTVGWATGRSSGV